MEFDKMILLKKKLISHGITSIVTESCVCRVANLWFVEHGFGEEDHTIYL